MSRQDAIDLCQSRFGLTWEEDGPWVPHAQLCELARALKEELGYGLFLYCAAAHLPVEVEVAEGEEPVPPTDSFEVHYRVRRLGPGAPDFPFRVKIGASGHVPSLSAVYAGADWQEREQFDLVGVIFEGHPDLRRIMLPEDWEGHPLRRDYAIETSHHPWR
jgi:NADH:ubiquinone oxidoreductase subunit C